MGEIEKVGNLNLNKSRIGISSPDIDLDKYCICLFKNSPFEVRNVEINELIQFNTNSQQYFFDKSHMGLFKNSWFKVRNVEIDESIQFDTNSQQFLFKKS